jgi:hypothetical protein
MAVAGNLNFCVVAEFEHGHVFIGCERDADTHVVAAALKIQEFNSLKSCDAHVGSITGVSQLWRLLSWKSDCATSPRQITICACTQSGSEAKIGWVGAVSVQRMPPADVAAVPADAALNSLSAAAFASRKMIFFDCASELETYDIHCFWSQAKLSDNFFPFVDIYLDANDACLTTPSKAELRNWQGRSASGVFIISDASACLPLQVVIIGTNCLLQRVELARIDVVVPWLIAPSANHE